MSIGPAPVTAPPPKIIALDFDSDGDVLVTWSLPGLLRATVRLPYLVWLNGGGLTIGKALTQDALKAGLIREPSGAIVTELQG